MTDFYTPDLGTIIEHGEQDIETELDGSQPRLPFTPERALNFSTSVQARGLYDFQEHIAKQIIPLINVSEAQTIIDRAEEVGVIQKAAEKATGFVVFVATNGSVIQVGKEMQRGDKTLFIATEEVLAVNDELIIPIEAKVAGVVGNTTGGVTLKLLSPISGVASSGLTDNNELTGGIEKESLEALYERYRFRKRYPPHGGAEFDYVSWALDIAGVTRAWTYPTWYGLGTIGLTFVRDFDTPIFPDAMQLQEVADYIYRHTDPATGIEIGRPVTADLVMISLREKHVDIVIGNVPSGDDRALINQEMRLMSIRELIPGSTLLVQQIQGAITRANVYDYTLDIAADIPSDADELLYIGVITWV